MTSRGITVDTLNASLLSICDPQAVNDNRGCVTPYDFLFFWVLTHSGLFILLCSLLINGEIASPRLLHPHQLLGRGEQKTLNHELPNIEMVPNGQILIGEGELSRQPALIVFIR